MSIPATSIPEKSELLLRRPRTHRVFSHADMERMHALYYDRETPLTRVAAAFSIPVSTLLRWIAEMDWPKRRAMAPPAPAPSPALTLANERMGDRRADSTLASGGARAESGKLLPAAFDFEMLRLDIKLTARADLEALRCERAPVTWADRERRSRVLASLLRSIDRIDANLDTTLQAHAIELVLHMLREGPGGHNEVTEALRDTNAQLFKLVRARMGEMMNSAGLLVEGAPRAAATRAHLRQR